MWRSAQPAFLSRAGFQRQHPLLLVTESPTHVYSQINWGYGYGWSRRRRWLSGPSETAHPDGALSFALRSWTTWRWPLATLPSAQRPCPRRCGGRSPWACSFRGRTASPAANLAQSVNGNLTFDIEGGWLGSSLRGKCELHRPGCPLGSAHSLGDSVCLP